MSRYRVTGPMHVNADGVYKKGAVIESDRELDKIFENTFEKAHPTTKISEPEQPEHPYIPPVPDSISVSPASTPTAPEKIKARAKAEKSKEDTPPSDGPQDVSADFELPEGARVVKKDDGFWVFDDPEEDEAAHEIAIETAEAVAEFIKEL